MNFFSVARSLSKSPSPSPPSSALIVGHELLQKIYSTVQENSVKIDRLQKFNDRLAESQKMCFAMITDIHEEVLLVKKYLKRHDTSREDESDFKSCLPELPLSSSDEMQKTEDLLDDNNEMAYLTKLLADLGGSKLSSVVHNIMKYALTKSMALQYSLKGRSGKKAFNDLKLYKCVLGELQ